MNQLFYGDNLDVMRRYIKDETVDLCYIDPPFNSKRNYNQIYNNIGSEDKAQAQAFVDTWTWNDFSNEGFDDIMTNHTYPKQAKLLIDGLLKVLGKGSLMSYLISMTQRINEIHRVLKPTGSFYLHCDPSASHYLKLICDAIFCSRKGEFINELVWKRTTTHNDAKQGAKHFGRIHDIILFYSKTPKYTFNTIFKPYSDEYLKSTYNKIDISGRRFKASDLSAAKGGGDTSFEWKGQYPPQGRFWAYSKDNFIKFEQEDKLYYSTTGKPYLKQYLDDMLGVSIDTIWTDIKPLSSKDAERLGYPTQKPESLLERIINACSNKGDIVLDAFCGCGTTIAIAERLKRKWIGIDITYQSISLILKRLEDTYGKEIIKNITLSGVPQDMESAVALANKADDRIRKEFEKWVVLSYSDNRAMINEKKGGDGGIDGEALVIEYSEEKGREYKSVIFSVKSNKTLSPTVIRDLNGTMERDKAVAGVFITLYPMPNLVKEATKYGMYENSFLKLKFPKIQVVSVEEILAGKRMNLPAAQAIEVTKKAKKTDTGERSLFD